MTIDDRVIDKIYAGWLAKIIGIRLGAPVENQDYDEIAEAYGEIHGYVEDYKNFAADDDSNGPIFFIRALEHKRGHQISQEDVAEAILNYVPYEHGFFWWGGYGISTEHTAYLNLYHGVPAHLSGSSLKNGVTAAEQIGGQIFIDTWGLVCPGAPDQAARFADQAASVMHDGNGRYGAIFVAVCISLAFVENDIGSIIKKALAWLPPDSEYVRVVRAVQEYHSSHPADWRAAYYYVREHFGYDKYSGNCHIIPNSAVMVLALLYGGGDFSRTIEICTMCGWDTDCNAGNVAAIVGVLAGTEAIDYDKWRRPVNDLLINSSVTGSLNIMDIPYGASYLARLACELQNQDVPERWRDIFCNRIDSCHFEYPGSVHAFRSRGERGGGRTLLTNSREQARTGLGSLKITTEGMKSGGRVLVYKKSYYLPDDFDDSRYDPSFAPLLYPGQRISCSVYVPEAGPEIRAGLYVREYYQDEQMTGEMIRLPRGEWVDMSFRIPTGSHAMLIVEAGIRIEAESDADEAVMFLDDFCWDGDIEYSIDFIGDKTERWSGTLRSEISQFTRYKGQCYIADEELHLSGTDVAAVYTGRHDWDNYQVDAVIRPELGTCHLINVRVQGAVRSYGAGFVGTDQIGIVKNHRGYEVKAATGYVWRSGVEYTFTIMVKDDQITLSENGKELLSWRDESDVYETGGIGITTRNNGHVVCQKLHILSEK